MTIKKGPPPPPPKPIKVPHYEPIRCFHYPKKSFSEILRKLAWLLRCR